ncbi:MAG: hypothetical protein EOM54_07285 [Clostridia bacterium]|nr:hypothetical protein [Clostridia bacterium]
MPEKKEPIPLVKRVNERDAARDLLYRELHENPLNLDEILMRIVNAVHYDYIGFQNKRAYFMPSEYKGYLFSHYRYNKLTLQMLARSMHQFAADMHDRRMKFLCDDWIDYQNVAATFRVRAAENALYVTEANEGCQLAVGDKIVAVQGMSIPRIRNYTRHTCFFSREPERELWGGYLRMAASVDVELKDGAVRTVKLTPVPASPVDWPVSFKMLDGKVAYLKLEKMDAAEVMAIIEAHGGDITDAEKLILDLRRNVGGEEYALWPLLPYIVDRPYHISELLEDEGSWVNCTENNCDLRYAQLEQFKAGLTDDEQIALVEDEESFWKENRGKGPVFCPPEEYEEDDELIYPAVTAPAKIVLITDTFCEMEGEAFVRMCRNAGSKVTVVGRPTMGTLDYYDTIALKVLDHMTLIYPIRETNAAHEGRGVSEKGLPVDKYIPWSPAELLEDILLSAALQV